MPAALIAAAAAENSSRLFGTWMRSSVRPANGGIKAISSLEGSVFFMRGGYLKWGEQGAQKAHSPRNYLRQILGQRLAAFLHPAQGRFAEPARRGRLLLPD